MEDYLTTLLIRSKVLTEGEFHLASGKQSDYYVDIKKASTNPFILSAIATKMTAIMSTLSWGISAVGAIELGCVPIATAVSLKYNIQMVIIRKKPKGHGLNDLFIGDVPERSILMIEDVTTTGESVIEAINNIRQHLGVVDVVMSVVDRNEGAKENLSDIGVKLISLVNSKDLRG